MLCFVRQGKIPFVPLFILIEEIVMEVLLLTLYAIFKSKLIGETAHVNVTLSRTPEYFKSNPWLLLKSG